MCGRMQHEDSPSWREVYQYSSTYSKTGKEPPKPKGDIAPTDTVPIIALRQGERRMTNARWQLVPRYVTELTSKFHTFNAREDHLLEVYEHWKGMPISMKHVMRSAFIAPFLDGFKCLIPMNSYYEYKDKRPYRFYLEKTPLFAAAGLWEWNPHVTAPGWPNGILSCTMITTTPNSVAAEIHDRMPVILRPDQYELWLSPHTYKEEALGMLRPYAGDDLRVERVRTKADDQMRMLL